MLGPCLQGGHRWLLERQQVTLETWCSGPFLGVTRAASDAGGPAGAQEETLQGKAKALANVEELERLTPLLKEARARPGLPASRKARSRPVRLPL